MILLLRVGMLSIGCAVPLIGCAVPLIGCAVPLIGCAVLLIGCAEAHTLTDGERFEDRLAMAYCEAASPALCEGDWTTVRDLQLCAYQRMRAAGRRRIDAIDEGRVRIDDEAVQRCLEETRCGNLTPEICDEVTIGLTPIDGHCEDHLVCAPGLYCERTGGCGTCQPRHALGDICRTPRECAPVEGATVTCAREDPATPVGRCVAAIDLATDVGNGGSCESVVVDETHVERPHCLPGLDCAGTTEMEAVCTAPGVGEGGPCTVDATCGAGLLCAGGTCVPGTLTTEVNHRCNEHEDRGVLTRCDRRENLFCLDRTCRPIPDRADAPCGWDGRAICGPGLLCSGSRCVRESGLENGDPCTVDAGCLSGRCGLSHRCVPRSC